MYSFHQAIAALSILLFAGCGSSGLPTQPVAKVDGRVTLQSQPVGGAEILFQPKEGPASSAISAADGSFSLKLPTGLDGAVVGEHTVRVVVIGVPGSATTTPPIAYLLPEPVQVNAADNNVSLSLDGAKKRPG